MDFGRVVMSEVAGRVLTLTNPSLLPHTFAFLDLPPGVSRA